MQIRIRTFNPQVLLESLFCGFFAGLLVYLIRSEKYLSYVTPRMKPYLYFSAIVLGIWALTGLLRLFQPQYKIRSMHCLVLAVPVIMLLLPHSPLEISDVTENFSRGSSMPTVTEAKPFSGALSMGGTGSQENGDKSGIEDVSDKESGALDSQNSSAAEDFSSLPGLDVQNKRITVSNKDFALWLAEMDSNGVQYEGYTVVITGYVMNDFKIPKENEFTVSRLAMTCCIADVSPTGLRCIYDKASELESESWVTVEGNLSIGEYQYNDITLKEPQIHVTKITPTDPIEGYVYPFV
ncbi:MAG: TIGR03943 family protein [Clostridiales bacterium]|nr:TIGR03943 family protein [Clostridiales bacterium]